MTRYTEMNGDPVFEKPTSRLTRLIKNPDMVYLFLSAAAATTIAAQNKMGSLPEIIFGAAIYVGCACAARDILFAPPKYYFKDPKQFLIDRQPVRIETSGWRAKAYACERQKKALVVAGLSFLGAVGAGALWGPLGVAFMVPLFAQGARAFWRWEKVAKGDHVILHKANKEVALAPTPKQTRAVASRSKAPRL